MRSRNQDFAKQVWEIIPYAAHDPQAKAYGGMAQKLPGLIRTAGLAQALAFVDSKTPEQNQPVPPAREVLNHLAKIVMRRNETTIKDMASEVRNVDLREYMRLTRRTLEVCLWFKRFAESKLDVKSGEEVEDANSEK
jgi:CRISPR-associated protein Cmr5